MVRVVGFLTIVLCLVSAVLLGAMTLLAPSVNPDGAIASSVMRRPNRPQWVQILDIERRLRLPIYLPLDDFQELRLMWPDGKYVYFLAKQPTEDDYSPLFTYYSFNLSTRELKTLIHDGTAGERSILARTFVQPSPDGRYLALLDSQRMAYHLIDSQTQTMHKLFDFENRDGLIFGPSLWSPTNDHLAIAQETMLYLVDLPDLTIREYQIAEEGTYYPSWSADGRQILLSSFRSPQPARIFDVTTGTFDPRIPETAVDWITWWTCDERWLTYASRDNAEHDVRLFSLFDRQTGTTRHINTLPELKGMPLTSMGTLDCEHLLLFGEPPQTQSPPDDISEYPLYIANLTTDTVVLVDENAMYIGWIDELKTIVYSKTVGGQRRQREVFKRRLEPFGQPERVGEYTALLQNSRVWSADYSAIIQAAFSSGTLSLTDLYTGQVHELTRPRESAEQLVLWD